MSKNSKRDWTTNDVEISKSAGVWGFKRGQKFDLNVSIRIF